MVELRRFAWLIGLLFVWSWLLFKLFDLQVIQNQWWRQISRDNQYFQWQVPAERGVFLDRYQEPLTLNFKQYFKLADEAALFSQRQPISREEALQLLATDSAKVSFSYYRQYPWAAATAHVLGFVGKPSATDLQQNRNLGPEEWLGKSGLERWFEDELHGRPGQSEVELNAPGRRRLLTEQQPAVPGATIITSLDPYLSQVALILLQQKAGAVVIEDAQTGQVLSLVSSPSFDPNLLTKPGEQLSVAEKASIANLFRDEQKPEFNRALAGTYPPGSIFKIVTALAGLEAKAIDATKTVIDEGILKVGEYSYANWYYTQYGGTEGAIALVKAIARSNDIYFYKAAEWTGPEKIAQMAKLLGMGRVSGLEIGLEAPGLIPDPSWKEQNLGEKWFLGNTYHMGIGQGDILVTPLQIAQLTQTVFNDGQLCSPSVLAPANPSRCQSLSLNSDDLKLVQEGMIEVCSSGGTAFPFFSYNQQFDRTEFDTPKAAIDAGMAACKTGTAEFGGVNEQGFRRTHAWFTLALGINSSKIGSVSISSPLSSIVSLPEEKVEELAQLHQQWQEHQVDQSLPKRLVITVLVESNEDQLHPEGSAEAAPVARSLINWIYSGHT